MEEGSFLVERADEKILTGDILKGILNPPSKTPNKQ